MKVLIPLHHLKNTCRTHTREPYALTCANHFYAEEATTYT